MKKDIAGFVAKYPNYQQVKVENQRPSGAFKEFSIPSCKWEVVNIDFMIGLPHMRRQHDSI